jgi:DNA-binding beta-propeller fold protein YncE
MANGHLAPKRVIEGQATKISRTIHVMDYDAVHDEIISSNPQAGAILIYRGGAGGDEAPIRVIQGPKTRLIFPHTVSIDTKHGEIFVGDLARRSVLVFARDAVGDVSPLRELTPDGYYGIVGTAVDPERNLLVLTSRLPQARDGALLIYNRTDNGNVKPRGIITGPKTGVLKPWDVEVHGGKIFVALLSTTYRALYDGITVRPGLTDNTEIKSPWTSGRMGFIGVWDIYDNGDVPPRAVIKGPVTGLVHPGGLAVNVKAGEIYATDSVRNGLFTFLVPEFFKDMK